VKKAREKGAVKEILFWNKHCFSLSFFFYSWEREFRTRTKECV